jgi:hypothetical protein
LTGLVADNRVGVGAHWERIFILLLSYRHHYFVVTWVTVLAARVLPFGLEFVWDREVMKERCWVP